MRKPRDYDAELRALSDKARELRARKLSQLGELVIATNADALTAEELAGALLAAAGTTDPATRAAWRKAGAAMFSGAGPNARKRARGQPGGAAPGRHSAPPADGAPGPA